MIVRCLFVGCVPGALGVRYLVDRHLDVGVPGVPLRFGLLEVLPHDVDDDASDDDDDGDACAAGGKADYLADE